MKCITVLYLTFHFTYLTLVHIFAFAFIERKEMQWGLALLESPPKKFVTKFIQNDKGFSWVVHQVSFYFVLLRYMSNAILPVSLVRYTFN